MDEEYVGECGEDEYCKAAEKYVAGLYESSPQCFSNVAMWYREDLEGLFGISVPLDFASMDG